LYRQKHRGNNMFNFEYNNDLNTFTIITDDKLMVTLWCEGGEVDTVNIDEGYEFGVVDDTMGGLLVRIDNKFHSLRTLVTHVNINYCELIDDHIQSSIDEAKMRIECSSVSLSGRL